MSFDLNRSPGSENEESESESFSDQRKKYIKTELESSDSGEAELQSHFNIAAEIENKLEVGSVVHGVDQFYVLYCYYARCMGFSVRKGSQKYFDNSTEIRMKVFNCSCEGQPDNKRSIGRIPVYKKQVTRSNCKARIRMLREQDGPWRISIFHKIHSHELVNPDQSYLLRSARNLSHAKQTILEALQLAGIPISRACKFMEKECGGRENVGFTRKGAYAHRERMRSETKVENGDTKAILQLFTEKSKTDSFFYWKVQLDDEGRLLNFFFRDSRCAIDYEYFGDVVSFDTTYWTNKYNMVCAPFVGINHHFKNVMFGLAFLSNEKTESFEWLFSAFLESMYGKEPDVIFSNQCQALMNGVDYIFLSASHCLCQWHINQNAPTHFGSLNENKIFKQQWHHCMNGCETEEEFGELWNEMMETYDLGNNRWFCTMYHLRRRWSSVFTNKKFTAGLHATSRSEVTNRMLKNLGKSSNSLYEFVVHCLEIQDDWRVRERAEDAMSRGMPGIVVDGNRLLTHIAKVFTRNVYKMFEYEATQSMNIDIVKHPDDYSVNELEFHLSSSSSKSSRVVLYNKSSRQTSCTCHLWEAKGVLCCHIFKVYYLMNVHSVPEQYILRRWRRDCRDRWGPGSSNRDWSSMLKNVNGVLFVNHIMRVVYDMAYEAKDNAAHRSLMHESILQLRESIAGKRSPTGKEVSCRPAAYTQ